MPGWLRVLLVFAIGITLATVLLSVLQPSLLQYVLVAMVGGTALRLLLPVLTGKVGLRSASASQRQGMLQAATPQAGQALLYVSRSGLQGMVYGFDIELDGRLLASLKSPRYLRANIPAGTHTLSAGMKGMAGKSTAPLQLTFSAAPDEVVIFTLTTASAGVSTAKTVLTREPDNAPALHRMASMKAVPVQQ